MISIAVLDDEKEWLRRITVAIRHCFSDTENTVGKRNEYRIVPFSDAKTLLSSIEKNGGFHIYILDVLLENEAEARSVQNGISLGAEIRRRDADSVLIYISSSRDFAAESYDVRAFYYLLKPFSERKFQSVLQGAVSLVEKQRSGILVKTPDQTERLLLDEILYAELHSRRVRYVCLERVVLGMQLKGSFKNAVVELLSDDRFCLLGASLVVNVSKIQSVGTHKAVFMSGQSLYVPRNADDALADAWAAYWLSTGGVVR